jgi:hypothetical protein
MNSTLPIMWNWVESFVLWNLGSVPEETKIVESPAPTPETNPTTSATAEESKPTNGKEELSEQANAQQPQQNGD